MSALEWLDAARADLDEATPGPWGMEVTDWDVSVFQHDQPDDPYAGEQRTANLIGLASLGYGPEARAAMRRMGMEA